MKCFFVLQKLKTKIFYIPFSKFKIADVERIAKVEN